MILHVAMDAFYASVEERERPELAGKPLIVGGLSDQGGVVAAANYAARRYGVHSAMLASAARELCPQGIFLPSRIELYGHISQQVRVVLLRYTPMVEPISLDEAYLDVSGSKDQFGTAPEIARKIKQAIRKELRLTASVGVAPTKLVAKIASDIERPDGLVVVDADRVREFLDPLPVERLWGVGRQSSAVFQQLGIQFIAQVRKLPMDVVNRRFGKGGRELWHLAHGIDERPVVPERQSRSLSHECTFERDIEAPEIVRAWLWDLTAQVAWRLRRQALCGRSVQITVRFADFSMITRFEPLAEPSDRTEDLWKVVEQLLATRLPAGHLPVRMLGVSISGVDAPGEAPGRPIGHDSWQNRDARGTAQDRHRDRSRRDESRRKRSVRDRRRKSPSDRPWR
jgi:DNA polymerase-4